MILTDVCLDMQSTTLTHETCVQRAGKVPQHLYAAHDTNLLNTLAASANSSFVLTVKYNREPTISACGTHP